MTPTPTDAAASGTTPPGAALSGAATIAFVLPPDVRIDPASAAIDGLSYQDGDHLVTRLSSRAPTHVIDAQMALLLERFRTPQSIVSAVMAHCAGEGLDPSSTLEIAFPGLVRLARADLLVPADSPLARTIEFGAMAGNEIGRYRIMRPVALLLDTEVHLARTPENGFAAIKIARSGAEARMQPLLDREAKICRRIDGRGAPRLLGEGLFERRPFIALEWLGGVDAGVAVNEARRRGPLARQVVGRIVTEIVRAYARLHQRGIVHGDVHPRNILLAGDGRAALIDFGHAVDLADRAGAGKPVQRGVIDLYMEPELARARLLGEALPQATERGEQYAVAALVYALLVGAPTHIFGLERSEMWRQVVEDPPLKLNAHGVSGWGSSEHVLFRALAKDPADRFPGSADFADALERAISRDIEEDRAAVEAAMRPPGMPDMVDELLPALRAGPASFVQTASPPLASVAYGAAGVAYALLRIASVRQDADLLALADRWSTGAIKLVRDNVTSALTSPDLDLGGPRLGPHSVHHGEAGIYVVDGLVAAARADQGAWRRAGQHLLVLCRDLPIEQDVSFGAAGLLLGLAALLQSPQWAGDPVVPALTALGERLAAGLEAALAAGDTSIASLGGAHGSAGILHALLNWARLTNRPVSATARRGLADLANLAEPLGSGLTWPIHGWSEMRQSLLTASWCNGTSAYVPLWLLAHDLLGDAHFRDLANGAGWTAYQAHAGSADLCCGLAGRTFALLALFRTTRDPLWLDRAREVAKTAADRANRDERPLSLFKGALGAALALAETGSPDEAAMPLFGVECEAFPHTA